MAKNGKTSCWSRRNRDCKKSQKMESQKNVTTVYLWFRGHFSNANPKSGKISPMIRIDHLGRNGYTGAVTFGGISTLRLDSNSTRPCAWLLFDVAILPKNSKNRTGLTQNIHFLVQYDTI